jgi:diaminohydroxyphosphoribosylaminopyrimidine deaminase/5-amino-6-(5-phosphoribosylamino)uracil reductase
MSFLERALELAERGRGTTNPNPVVGAVLVRDGEVVGEGWHERKGEPHAEANAIAAAGDRARARPSTSRSSRARMWAQRRRAPKP